MKLTFGALALLTLTLAPSAHAASRPDLRVGALSRATAAPGATVTLKTTVANAGRARAARSVTRFVASADAKRDKRDTVLATAKVRSLARGKKATLKVTFKLPSTPGTFRLLACADDLRKVRESREANNCSAARLTLVAASPASAPDPAPQSAPAPVPAPAPASPCAATDVPDLAHVDSDCDGIDGTAAASIFVAPTGDDAAAGTKAAPKRTVIAGIAAAAQSGRSAVLIAAGQYAERPYLVSGISLYGGYDATTWQRSDVNVTAITGAASIGGAEGLRAQQILDPTTLQRLRVSSPNASFGSSYGIVAVSAPRLRLERVEVFAGKGAKGAAGQPGSDGDDGQPGIDGKPGGCDSNVAGAGGGGGGGSYGLAFGGAGGQGGTGSLMINGKSGHPGWGLTLGGDGGTTGDPGKAGANGANGLPGSGGTPGTPGAGGAIVNGFWQGGAGSEGGQGEPGRGGGGGGGGGGQHVWGFYGGGNGGGGGGEGGHGGTGGKGGKGGGGSFGLFAIDSLGMVVSDSTISSSAGGHGGAGGYPGNAGQGAPGGVGAKACLGEIGAGGNGGHGGMGGKGGMGGSGAGGPSYALFGTGGKLNVTNTVLTFGAAGDGGYPGTAAQRFGV